MSKITQLKAYEIIDSRGKPTVSVDIVLDGEFIAEASVPSGASTGVHEALELRDNDQSRYGGNGVLVACENINIKINKAVNNKDFTSQKKLDQFLIELDGTENKGNLGANAILGVSLAFARAKAKSLNKEIFEYIQTLSGNSKISIPKPMMNILNGGKHADNKVDIQEFMIMPKRNSIAENIRIGSEVFYALKKILNSKRYTTGVGDEGGFAPNLKSNEEALDLIMKAIKTSGYLPGADIDLAIDAAASSFYNEENKNYVLKSDNLEMDADKLVAMYKLWIDKYPLVSIEDPLFEDDWSGFAKFTGEFGNLIQIVGDDHYVTNTKRLKRGIKEKTANAILIKLNQIGTLSETLEAIALADKNNFNCIISHRSGETCDDFIADLAVAVSAKFIKTGSVTRGERITKYNRLMKIENIIKNHV